MDWDLVSVEAQEETSLRWFDDLWYGGISHWKQPSEDGYCGHKGIDVVSNNKRVGFDI